MQVRPKFAARLSETATVEAGIAVTWFVTGFPDPCRTGRSTTPSPGSAPAADAARVARPVFDEPTGRGVHVTQAFGMSEGLFLFTPLDAPAGLRAETAGVPISPFDEVRVLRPGTEVEGAEGETGELAAPGPYTIRGYLAAPDRDREAFTAEGFYRSGDLVRARRYHGSLSYSSEGRVNDLIDRGGEKVNAEEVELLVAGHPAVAEMALVGMPDPRLDERG